MRPDKTDKKTAFSCPSYISKPGAELFGIVNKAGYVEYLHQAIRIDQTFVDEARKGRTPESRFRFSGKCIEGACQKWNAEQAGCGLVDEIIERYAKRLFSICDRNSKLNVVVSFCPLNVVRIDVM